MHDFHFIKKTNDKTNFVVYSQDFNEDFSEKTSHMFICYCKNQQVALLIASALQQYDKTWNRKYVFDETIMLP